MDSSAEKTTKLDLAEGHALKAELPPVLVPHPADTAPAGAPQKVLHLTPRQFVSSLSLIAATAIFVRTAWMSDDAYISLRVVDNFVHGFGLRWNVIERVQAMTNPLWTLLLAIPYYFTREAYFTTLVVSWLCLLATFGLGTTFIAYNSSAAWFLACSLLTSRAFVEYSSSGLENPLSYLLLAIFLTRFLARDRRPKDVLVQSLCFSLLLVNRMDNLWFTLPAMALTLWEDRRNPRAWKDLAIGCLPFVVWEAFSLFYYGFPFPNTYYAKLSTGIPQSEYWAQGFRYLIHFIATDPSSFFTLAAALLLGAVSRSPRKRLVAVGLGLHVVYVLRVGGDFMNGRFFATSVLVATLFLSASSLWLRRRLVPLAITVLTVLSLSLSTSPLRTNDEYSSQRINEAGIADERGWYYTAYNLGLASLSKRLPRVSREVRETYTSRPQGIGVTGFNSGPAQHAIDAWGLSDPLLARIPAMYEPNWRIGHFTREIPFGYDKASLTGKNELSDEKLGQYWEKLTLITRGPLFSLRRWGAIVAINLGMYDSLVDFQRYRYPGRALPSLLLTRRVTDGTSIKDSRLEEIGGAGIRIEMGDTVGAPSVELSLAREGRYAVVFLLGKRELGTLWVEPKPGEGMYSTQLELPPTAANGFDTIYIKPLSGPSPYAIGHALLGEPRRGHE